MIKLDFNQITYDKMRQSVVIAAGRGRVIVSLEALENFFNRPLDPDDAVEAAIEASTIIRLAANATPGDDGLINITSKILNGRNWELGEAEEDDAD
jgi:hypothetical protein